ncbi:MAG: hypothetical protein ACRELB_13420 [Polyangiaceae bacterium]
MTRDARGCAPPARTLGYHRGPPRAERRGIKDILLNHARLWEELRAKGTSA